MEESDIPLIEISGEDDSLLQQSPAIIDITHFAPSPLQLPRSHSLSQKTSVTKTNADSRSLVSSSYSNKENLNTSDKKSGMANLSIEPQKMKRSKKGGGYNLRKSLAWDRAFLTEEGVLDSLELSMITGTRCELDGDSLSVIEERGGDLNSKTGGGSTNLKTLGKTVVKELPSGKPNERDAARTPFLKRDSLASVSKSSQKILPRHSYSKTVFKGNVTSPAAPASQKRLLNLGTTKGVTRNSKIPKFPVPKQDTCFPPTANSKIPKFSASRRDSCLPSVTATNIAASGSCSKVIGIAQPAAQKTVNSTVSSNIKNVSSATKASSERTSKSSRPSAEHTKKDATKPSLEMNLSTNRHAQHMKNSSNPEMTLNKRLPTGGADAAKSIHGISNIKVSSHCNPTCVDDNKKDLRGQGIKPSGLRMPSPSLRFFSEPNLPGSNAPSKDHPTPSNLIKSSISTSRNQGAADHVHDLGPEQLLQGAINLATMGKAGLSSQMVEKFSTSETIDLTTDFKVIRDACNQQEVKVQIPLGVKTTEKTNTHSRPRAPCEVGEQYMGDVSISMKDEERDRKDDKLVLSSSESMEVNHRSSIVSKEHRNDEECISEISLEPSLEVQLDGASESNRQVQPEVEGTGHHSPVISDKVMPGSQTDSTIHFDTLGVAAGIGLSSSMADDNKPLEEIDFSQIVNEGSMGVKLGGDNLLPDSTSSLILGEGDYAVLLPEDRDVAIGKSDSEDLYSLFACIGSYSVNCSNGELDQSVAVEYEQQHLDNKQGDEIADDELSTMKVVSNCSEMQGDVGWKDDRLLRNGDFKDKELCVKFMNDDKDISNVLAETGHESKGRSSQSQFSFAELPNEDVVEEYHSPITSQGEIQVQTCYRHGTADSYAPDHCTSVAYTQCTEVTEHVLEEELPVRVPDILLEHRSPKSSQEEMHARIIDNMDKVYNSLEDVEDQTCSLTLLSGNVNDSTGQATNVELHTPAMGSKDELLSPVANSNIEEPCSPDNRHELQPRHVEEYIKYDKSGRNVSPREPEMNFSQEDDGFSGENKCNKKGIDCMNKEDANCTLRTFQDDQKLTRTVPNAIPFTDEWLAAIEAAGEEILTLKTGAVQNSPPDKSNPEPSPWSPVKRKSNQVIGPFDCTKYTNGQHNCSD